MNYASNLLNGLFVSLISNSSKKDPVKMNVPDWRDNRKSVSNYEIWDLYRHSFEWIINILDVYHLTTDIKYYNLCEFIFKSWLNEFGDLSNKYNSNQLWDDHTISSRIMSFICFHEFSEKNNLSNIDLSIDTIKHINKNSLLCQ